MKKRCVLQRFFVVQRGGADHLRCRGRPCKKRKLVPLRFLFLFFCVLFRIKTMKWSGLGIADPRRCRGHPCKKIENLFHCVFIFVFLQILQKASFLGFVGKQKERSKNFALFCGERGSAKALFFKHLQPIFLSYTDILLFGFFSCWRTWGAPVINIILIIYQRNVEFGDFCKRLCLHIYYLRS